MVRVRNLLVMSLASTVFLAVVKGEYTQEPPCLKTRVLQSSPQVPKTKCAACEKELGHGQKENYVLVPINDESNYNLPQKSENRPSGYALASNYRQTPNQQSSSYQSPTQKTRDGRGQQLSNTVPQCNSISNCQSHFYLVQSSTQVINHIEQPSSHQSHSYLQVPRSGHTNVPTLSYKPKVTSDSRPSYKAKSVQANAVTPLHHLAANKNERRPSFYKAVEKTGEPKYQPGRLEDRTKPKVSVYNWVLSPRETKKSYAGKTLFEGMKSDEKKLSHGKVPAKQSLEISCRKCQKSVYSKPSKDNYNSRGQY